MSKFAVPTVLALLAVLIGSPASAQSPATSTTHIFDLARNPKTRVVLEAYMPTLLTNPDFPQYRDLTLKQLQGYAPDKISNSLLDSVDQSLAEADKPPTVARTPIFLLAADPRTRAVLEAYMAPLLTDASYQSFKFVSLKALQGYAADKISDSLLAQVDKSLSEAGDPPTPAPPTMSAPVSRIVKALMNAAGKRDWAMAEAKLQQVRAVPGPSAFDLIQIDAVASFIAINTGDHPTALAAYKRMIANPLFLTVQTSQEQGATLKNAMILSNEAGDFTGAIGFGEKLAAAGSLGDMSANALAFAYWGNKDYAKAQVLAQKSIDAAVAAGKKPDESALQIVLKSKAGQH